MIAIMRLYLRCPFHKTAKPLWRINSGSNDSSVNTEIYRHIPGGNAAVMNHRLLPKLIARRTVVPIKVGRL
jgi:hypothetical protein